MIPTKFAPQSLKQSVLYKQLSRKRRLWTLRKQLSSANLVRVVLGAGKTSLPGWFHTDKEMLDVTNPGAWRALFEPDSIDSLLSEHMLEHLTEDEARIAVTECYRYLKPGGLFRIAVPDGYRQDPAYVAEVSPPRDGHKTLFNIDSLSALLKSVGYQVRPLEYFDAQDRFHAVVWDEQEGFVFRSVRFNRDEPFRRHGVYFTSLIVDARKPS